LALLWRSRLRTAALCAAAFVVAVLVAPRLFPRPPTDFVGAYHPGAYSLQQGHGYVDAAGRLVESYPPGYSLVIAPFVRADAVESLASIRLVHGALAAVLAWLLTLLADRLLPERWRGPAVLLALFWPPQLALAYPGGSEILFAVLVTAAALPLVSVHRARKGETRKLAALAVGALLGLATMVRTMGLSIAGAVLLSILLASNRWSLRRRLATCGLVLLTWLLFVTPWVAFYTASTGRVGFTSTEVGMVGLRLGFQRFESFAPGRLLEERRLGWQDGSDVRRDLIEASRRWPAETMELLTVKLFRAWYAGDSGRFDALVLPMNLPWAVLFLLASARSLWRWRRTPGEVVALEGAAVASWLSAFVTSSLLRYMAPVFPFAVLVIAWHLADALRERGARTHAVAGSLVDPTRSETAAVRRHECAV